MVAEHEGVTYAAAEHHAEAVLGVLQENLPSRQTEEIFSHLPADYADFLMRSRELALSSK